MPENPGTASQVESTATPPQVGANVADPQVGEAPNGLTLEQAQDALRKARAEAAQYRVKLNQLEATQQEAERAKLSKEEQLAAKVSDLERTLTEREQAYQEARIVSAVEKAAAKLGVVDADAAYKLLDLSELETDADGKPKNVDALLRALVNKRPYLAGPAAVSPTNPDLNHSHRNGIRMSQLQDLEFYAKNERAIKQAIREGTIIKD